MTSQHGIDSKTFSTRVKMQELRQNKTRTPVSRASTGDFWVRWGRGCVFCCPCPVRDTA